MKKILTAILVIALCIGAWFLGYHTRKSNDNLPSLTAIAQMSESEVNSLLPGYHIDQLREVWGKADHSDGSTDLWHIDDITLFVSYKNNGKVAICSLQDSNGASVGE